MNNDPHRDTPIHQFGVPLEDSAGIVILLHGRGGTAQDVLSLAREMYLPSITYLAPQALGNSWYPHSFLAPIEQNQPWLTSALGKVHSIVETAREAGIAAERIVIGGFSQGACLATEFVASHPRRYAGLVAFTGGLIGPIGTELTHGGNLGGMPAFMGSGDPDPHVPWQRVKDSAQILSQMGATVTAKRYEGRGHTISREEIEFANRLIITALGELQQ